MLENIMFRVELYQNTLVYGGRHFYRCSVSPEMFIWLHLINPVIELGARGHAVLVKYLQTDHRRKLVISGSDFGIVDVISSAMLQSPHFICSFIFSISSIMFWGSSSGGQSFTLLIAQITYLTIKIYGPLSTWAQWNFGEIPAILHLTIFSYEI